MLLFAAAAAFCRSVRASVECGWRSLPQPGRLLAKSGQFLDSSATGVPGLVGRLFPFPHPRWLAPPRVGVGGFLRGSCSPIVVPGEGGGSARRSPLCVHPPRCCFSCFDRRFSCFHPSSSSRSVRSLVGGDPHDPRALLAIWRSLARPTSGRDGRPPRCFFPPHPTRCSGVSRSRA